MALEKPLKAAGLTEQDCIDYLWNHAETFENRGFVTMEGEKVPFSNFTPMLQSDYPFLINYYLTLDYGTQEEVRLGYFSINKTKLRNEGELGIYHPSPLPQMSAEDHRDLQAKARQNGIDI